MARNDRKFRIEQFAVDDVQISAADAARSDLYQDFAGRRHRPRPLAHCEGRTRLLQHHGAHEPCPIKRRRSLLAILPDARPFRGGATAA